MHILPEPWSLKRNRNSFICPPMSVAAATQVPGLRTPCGGLPPPCGGTNHVSPRGLTLESFLEPLELWKEQESTSRARSREVAANAFRLLSGPQSCVAMLKGRAWPWGYTFPLPWQNSRFIFPFWQTKESWLCVPAEPLTQK